MEKADLSKKSPVRLHYTNSKGKQVCIGITQHARKRFIERWGRIYPDTELDPATVDSKIAEFFAQTIRQKTYVSKAQDSAQATWKRYPLLQTQSPHFHRPGRSTTDCRNQRPQQTLSEQAGTFTSTVGRVRSAATVLQYQQSLQWRTDGFAA